MSPPVDPHIQRLLMASPKLAYAEAMYGPLVAYPFTITAGFTAANIPAPILNQVSGDDPFERDILIDKVGVDIQTPNFNTGSLFKPEADIAYDLTSGIQATVKQQGAFGREYDQIPLKDINGICPMMLLTEQSLFVSFYVTTPLPSNSTIVTLTFYGRTSLKDRVFRMDMGTIFAKLDELGYYTDQARRVFLSAD